MRFIDSRTHAVIDYMSGILFIASPWLFGFFNHGAAMSLPLIAGVSIIMISLITDFEYGLLPAVSLPTHLNLDVIIGVILLASPWVFGFTARVMWPHVIFGMVLVIAGLFTERQIRPALY
ncbi:SPW repeat protein [Lunatibacter salilacus]|uniref:SPW repeat protein n=1 Tax=Lunatibacter salilacus TaxID=2483804 RepID=UPI00131A8F80|nr:SPW repeat protein [Lunatibacter salilacus]